MSDPARTTDHPEAPLVARRHAVLPVLLSLGVAALAAVVVVAFALAGPEAKDGHRAEVTVAQGTSAAPPWPAPTGRDALEDRAEGAGLEDVWGRDLAMHDHTHVTITVDGEPVTVPGDVGHDEDARFAAEIHTHDTSGIVHVESPTDETFTLGQFFSEWGVALDEEHVGSLGGTPEQQLTVWVGGKVHHGDPAEIVLEDLVDVDLVLAPEGRLATPPAPFDWPANYR